MHNRKKKIYKLCLFYSLTLFILKELKRIQKKLEKKYIKACNIILITYYKELKCIQKN
jgi:hypothetical protein